MIKTPKKLIEVALPLDAINVAAAREKSIRHGHPSTLHLWWARRPLEQRLQRGELSLGALERAGLDRGVGEAGGRWLRRGR